VVINEIRESEKAFWFSDEAAMSEKVVAVGSPGSVLLLRFDELVNHLKIKPR